MAHHARPGRLLALTALITAACCIPVAHAADEAEHLAQGDLTDLSLDQLMRIEITSVSKRPETLSSAAAAVFVLTGDDIRRAGIHRIANALRLVPGLDVAQIDARQFAVSSRGFNASSADKLLVLLDGRTVYTPLTSAVFWDVLDTDINDVDRIEVIRGPGAALWGANAVNGVINIVTKRADETLGTRVNAGGGTIDRSYGAIRSGTRVGSRGAVRIYAKAADRAPGEYADGSNAHDSSTFAQAGFRSDWTLDTDDSLTVSGDVYGARFNTPPNPALSSNGATRAQGGNLLGRWTRGDGRPSGWTLQAYYDHYRREIPGTYGETRDNIDLDFQRRQQLREDHTLLFGLGYRLSHDDTEPPPQVAIIFLPASRTLDTQSAFVQDQWQIDDNLQLTVGSKFEHNDYTGFEFQPSVRMGWQALDNLFTWAAVSRAVRTPNRLDSNIAIYCAPGVAPVLGCTAGTQVLIGNPDLHSENMVGYEWGLRFWLRSDISADLTTFYNSYRQLLSSETSPGSPLSAYDNRNAAHSHGGELTLNWTPRPTIRAQAFYSLLRIDADADADSTDTTTARMIEGSSPREQAGLRLLTQPADRWKLDGFLRYVDSLPAYSVPAYAELGLRVAYQPAPGVEVSVSGQNLLDDRHVEWGSPATARAVSRSVQFEFAWTWQ